MVTFGSQFVRAANSSLTSIGTVTNPYQLVDYYGLQGIGSTTGMLGSFYQLNNAISNAQSIPRLRIGIPASALLAATAVLHQSAIIQINLPATLMVTHSRLAI